MKVDYVSKHFLQTEKSSFIYTEYHLNFDNRPEEPRLKSSIALILFLFLLDIDECMDSPCVNGTCKNFEGGFMCECAKGFNVDNTGRVCKGMYLSS